MRTNTIKNFAKRLVMVLAVSLMAVNAWADVAKWDYSSDGLSNTVKGQITVSYAQNNGTNDVTVSSNYLRLFRQNASPYNGCSATWTAASGYRITAITVTFGKSCRSSARGKINNGSYEDVFSAGSSLTITISSLSASSYSIQNQATGSTTVIISSVTVTYESTCSNSVTINKGTSTNCTFTLSKSGAQASCDGVSTTVTVSPNTGYGSPSVTQSGASAAPTITGSGNSWTVAYGANTTGTSTINVSCSAKTYTVTLNDNGGSGGSESKTVTYNANTNMTTAVAKPTRTHYDFGGYWTSSDAGTTLTTQIIDENGAWKKSVSGYTDATPNWVNDGGVTLYAKWTEHSVTNYRTICSTTYDITLDDGEVATTYNGSAKVAASGTQLTNITAPTKTGYKVEGYYAEDKTTLIAAADGTLETGVEDWTDGDGKWIVNDDATLYAKWEPISYSVRFNKNNGSATGTMSDESYDYDESQKLTDNAFSLTGYTFAGWATTSDGDVVHTDGKSVSNLSSTDGAVVDLYAIWTANKYTLTLSASGETSSVGNQTVQATYGSSMPLVTTADGTPAVVDPSKTGYTFDGWEYNSTQYYSYDAGEDEISSAHVWDVASTATLTPRWNINSYTLTWNLDGGTVTEAGTGAAVDATGTPNSEVEYNAAITVPTVTRAGYNFAGWDVTPASNMPASNVTYTATWTEKTVTGWTWTNHRGGATITSDPIVVYVGQKVRMDIAYLPADVLSTHTVKENYAYTRSDGDSYLKYEAKASAYFTFSGKAAKSSTSITFTHTEDTSDPKAFAKTVNVEVRALPTDTYLDLVHGISFSGPYGASLVDSDYGVQFTYTAPGGDVSDWSSSYANTCEQYHVHLIGWVESTWADEHLGDAVMPNTAAIISSGYYHPVGETMTVSGKTYYAVWAKVE